MTIVVLIWPKSVCTRVLSVKRPRRGLLAPLTT